MFSPIGISCGDVVDCLETWSIPRLAIPLHVLEYCTPYIDLQCFGLPLPSLYKSVQVCACRSRRRPPLADPFAFEAVKQTASHPPEQLWRLFKECTANHAGRPASPLSAARSIHVPVQSWRGWEAYLEGPATYERSTASSALARTQRVLVTRSHRDEATRCMPGRIAASAFTAYRRIIIALPTCEFHIRRSCASAHPRGPLVLLRVEASALP